MKCLYRAIGVLGLFLASVAHANQCYPDAQSAYQAVLAKERQTKDEQENFVININTAHPSELISLKGVGVKTAEAIVTYREMMGRFETVDDLTKVKGIGQKTVDNNRHRLVAY